ncbi:MAG: hypothetical protein NTU49_04070, partial [Gammaproteobacteria bacterium]|nr:hypothetical protein [Gammaproteobacteria bacterium]
MIPKVRAVYRKETKESAPEFFATSSKRFSNFMSLKDYLGSNFGVRGYEAQTKEKLDVLIASGFAEVLALSYFYEEDDLHKDNIGIVYETVDGKTVVKKVVRVDFDMSAFSIVGQEQFRGPRPVAEDYIPFYSKKSAEERFAISDHNIKYFPFLKPAVPGEEMGGQPHYHPTIKQIITASHGYTDAEIAEFSKLSENKDFQKRSYLAFLKITLTPDRTIKNTLAEHIADPEILDIFYHHFVVRKKKLRNAVENCDKYKLFWEKLCDEKDFSNSSIQKMFSKMRIRNFSLKVEQSDLLNMDMDEVAKSYNAFCLVMSDEKIIESVHYLTNLIEFLHADDLAQGKEAKFKALHEPSVTLRNEIMNAHAALCENKEAPPSEDLEFFFRKMLDALKKFALSIKPSDKSKLSKLSLFIDSIENSLRQFIHHSYFI